MKDKIFHFNYPISGTCDLQIEAKTPEEALEKFNKGEYKLELNDWDVDFGWEYNPTVKELMKNCSNKSELNLVKEKK